MDRQSEPDKSGPEATRRDMADALAAIVYSALPDLSLDFANRYAVEYFGVATEEIAGDRWIELVHPDDRASVLAAWDASRATGQHYRYGPRMQEAGALGGREQPARTQNRILRLSAYREARGSQGAIGCFP